MVAHVQGVQAGDKAGGSVRESSPSTAHGGSTRQSRGKELFKEFASLYYGGLLEDLFQFNGGCKSQWEYCGILWQVDRLWHIVVSWCVMWYLNSEHLGAMFVLHPPNARSMFWSGESIRRHAQVICWQSLPTNWRHYATAPLLHMSLSDNMVQTCTYPKAPKHHFHPFSWFEIPFGACPIFRHVCGDPILGGPRQQSRVRFRDWAQAKRSWRRTRSVSSESSNFFTSWCLRIGYPKFDGYFIVE